MVSHATLRSVSVKRLGHFVFGTVFVVSDLGPRDSEVC